MSFVLHLPFPPSVNASSRAGVSRRGKPFVYSSETKLKFLSDADALYMTQARKLVGVPGPFTYHLTLNKKMRHGNADGDNRGKYVLDFLQRVGLIENDKLAEGGSWSWGDCEYGSMIRVSALA